MIIGAFVNGFQITLFPAKERGLTVRAPVFGDGTMAFAELKKLAADFTAQLRSLFAIVEIQILRRRLTT